MRHALTMAMQEFEGAMIIVSHDRHLLRTVTDNFMLVANGRVVEFDGSLEDYRDWLSQQAKVASSITGKSASTDKITDLPSDSSNRKQQRQNSAERRKQLRPAKRLRNWVRRLPIPLEALLLL